MKICVYAICKNEEANINGWVKSMSEADEIYVLDTGSTDKSVKLLKSLGVYVKRKKIKPFRFDIARNESLKMVPSDTDLYVCTDLDERFTPGWRKIIEENYTKDYSRIKYTYNWSFTSDKKPAVTFYLNKIHNNLYSWSHPVHEVLTTIYKEKELFLDKIVLNHYQKPKIERKNYLPLLELSVKESPFDDRNMHYLGREYLYNQMYLECIDTLHKHLELKSASWKDERSASMRFIARSYKNLKYDSEAYLWYILAIEEAGYLRENYVEFAFFLYEMGMYKNAIKQLDKAFKITEKSKTYINEDFAWNYQIYDLYSICSYHLGNMSVAKYYNMVALSLDPDNTRLKENSLFFKDI